MKKAQKGAVFKSAWFEAEREIFKLRLTPSFTQLIN